MNTTSFSYVFNYKKKDLQKDDCAPIHLQIYRRGALRKYVATGLSCTLSNWDEAKQQIIAKNCIEQNKMLRDFIANLQNYEYTLINKGLTLTSELLDDYLNNRCATVSFTNFFKNEIDPALRRGTRKEHQYTLNLLKEFKKNVDFSDINLTLIQAFDRFLRYDKHLKQNTIHKHHQHINRFLRLAEQKELFDSSKNPYTHFKSKKEKGTRINLSTTELASIENLPTQNTDIDTIRLMFLFSCYTGLRFSDVVTLTPADIVRNANEITIVKKMEKVPKPVILPISLLFNGKAVPILEFFLSRSLSTENKPIFPTLTNQHVNRGLKIIAIATGIHMNLTFHIARHTFGSMLADITQNPYLIMDLMGHEKIETSMIYIHRSQERINRQLRGINWNI